MFLKYSLEFSARNRQTEGIVFGALYMLTREHKETRAGNIKIGALAGVSHLTLTTHLKWLHKEGYINLVYTEKTDKDKRIDWQRNGVPLFVNSHRYISITEKGEALFAKGKQYLRLDDQWVSQVPLSKGYRLVIAKFQQVYDLNKHKLSEGDTKITFTHVRLKDIAEEVGLTYMQVKRVVRYLHRMGVCTDTYGGRLDRRIDFETSFFSLTFDEYLEDKVIMTQDGEDKDTVVSNLVSLKKVLESAYTRLMNRRNTKYHRSPKFCLLKGVNYADMYKAWYKKEKEHIAYMQERFNTRVIDKLVEAYQTTLSYYDYIGLF